MQSIQSDSKEDVWGDPIENQPGKRRLGSWCEMAASLGISQLLVESSVLHGRLQR
jgi:hypothetical protein